MSEVEDAARILTEHIYELQSADLVDHATATRLHQELTDLTNRITKAYDGGAPAELPGLPVYHSGAPLVIDDDIELHPGDLLERIGADEYIIVLSAEFGGVIYYSTRERDYGYYPREFLREDLEGIGSDDGPVLEFVDDDVDPSILPVYSVTVWTDGETKTIHGVCGVETEFGDENTITLTRRQTDAIEISSPGAVVKSIDPAPDGLAH